MDNAELYARYNSMQRHATETILKQFASQFAWSDNENALDIGCGPGDVTAEVLLPQLPYSSSIIGVDLSSKMVEYANKTYSNRRVHFKTLDFSTKTITKFFKEKSFSKIFSFYCLHWIQDQQQAARNILTLLRPGGEFLFLLAPSNNVFKVYKILSQMDKWKCYMKDVDKFIPSFYNSTDPCEEMRQVLSAQGLQVLLCEERKQTASFPNIQILMRSNEAVNPFVKRMPQETREQYMACFEQVIEEHQLFTETVSGEILTQNPVIVVYGRSPPL